MDLRWQSWVERSRRSSVASVLARSHPASLSLAAGVLVVVVALPRNSAGESGRIVTVASYRETCGLVASWCVPVQGAVPKAIRRPLRLPHIPPGQACPRTGGTAIDNGQFRGIALGVGPVRPLVAADPQKVGRGVVPFVRRDGWWAVKTLWFSTPAYRGPLLIRGRRLSDGTPIVFGERPTLI